MAKKVTDLSADNSPTVDDVLLGIDLATNSARKIPVGALAAPIAASLPVGSVPATAVGVGSQFAARISATQAWASTTATRMNFATEEYDTLNEFATNRFTALNAGTYTFDAAESVQSNAASLMFISLYKNGTELRRGARVNSSAGAYWGLEVSAEFQLAAGDYVEVFVTCNAGTSMSTESNGATGYFNGRRVA